MAAVEVVYLVAATLWIAVVTGAAGFAVWFALKLRAKRRRINHLLAMARLPIEVRRYALAVVRFYERR